MISRLPSTPLETLSLSSALSFIVKTIHALARFFGFWDRPLKNATSDFEEMPLLDKIYWGYKSKNPVIRAEKGSGLETYFKNSGPLPRLPEGFTRTHSLTFAGVGDLIKVDGLENSCDTFYEDVAPLIFQSDISYANIESQLTAQDISGYVFSAKETPPLCCTPAQYATIKGHRGQQFTALHTACNHTLDMGLEGLETTLAQLEKDDILDLGTNRQESQQFTGRIIEKNGIKIGFVSAAYGLNGKAVPTGKEWMVNIVKFHSKRALTEPVDMTLLNHQIADCKAHQCDIIVASLHWGYEYEFFPRRNQVEIAHTLIEAGVDVIIGHHSHVLQPIEFYTPRRDPQRTAVIAYSLGNLTSYYSAPHLVLSGIINLTFTKGLLNGETKTLVETAKMIPVVQRESLHGDRPALKLQLLDTFIKNEKLSGDPEMQNYVAAVEKYAKLVLPEEKK